MKTTFRAALTLIAVIAAGVIFWRGALMAMGTDRKTVAYETFQDMMITAKQGFIEKSDAVQHAAALLLDNVGLDIVTAADGTPMVDEDGKLTEAGAVLDSEEYAALSAVMGDYESGAKLMGVNVTEKAVLFYYGYLENGVYGVIYEKELGNTTEYETIELTENWRLFYRLPVV